MLIKASKKLQVQQSATINKTGIKITIELLKCQLQ